MKNNGVTHADNGGLQVAYSHLSGLPRIEQPYLNTEERLLDDLKRVRREFKEASTVDKREMVAYLMFLEKQVYGKVVSEVEQFLPKYKPRTGSTSVPFPEDLYEILVRLRKEHGSVMNVANYLGIHLSTMKNNYKKKKTFSWYVERLENRLIELGEV